MFDKILLPCDGSPTSLEAAAVAARLACVHGAMVQPLVAVEYQLLGGADVPEDVARVVREGVQRRAESALRAARDLMEKKGARVGTGQIREGHPSEVILREAAEGDFGLIVIGSRGVSLEQGFHRLVGSVTERVLHRAPCPVLVVRAQED